MTPLIIRSMSSWARAGNKLEDWHWFDLSGVSNSPTEPIDLGRLLATYQPPFRKCMVVWQTMSHGVLYDLCMMLNDAGPEQGVLVAGAIFDENRGFNIPHFSYRVHDGEAQIDDPEVLKESNPSHNLLMTLMIFYRTLQRARTTCYQPIPQKSFINQRRAEKGKPLRYDWRTVVLEPREQTMQSLGGTHASPRQHDRRGHQRVLRSGKVVWVRECKVGKAEHGVVRHVYEAPRIIQ